MKLTDLQCKKARIESSNYKLRDGKGLYLPVMKAGGKSWRYDYKLKTVDEAYKNGTFVYGFIPKSAWRKRVTRTTTPISWFR